MRAPSSIIACAFLLPLIAPGTAPAQEADADMAAYIAAAAPGEQHEWLAGMAGEFDVTTKMWFDPAAEPVESTSRHEAHMGLGGRYLMDHYEGSMLGTAFEGVGITGYDNTLGKFVSSWIDNMGTGILNSVGEMDDEGRLVMVGEFTDPVTGQTAGLKSITWKTDTGYVSELYNILPDGTEYRSMVLTAERKE